MQISTVDFESSGSLSLIDDDGNEFITNYTDKNLTQFIGLTTTTSTFTKGIDVRKDDFTFASISGDEQIRVRILSTLQAVEYDGENFGLSVGDRISLKTIGVEDETIKSDWFYNVKSKLDIKSIHLSNPSSNIYTIEFIDNHDLVVGYKVEITDVNLNAIKTGEVTSVDSSKILNVKLVTPIPTNTLNNTFFT